MWSQSYTNLLDWLYFLGMDIVKEWNIKKNGYLCHELYKVSKEMKNNNTDSTANLSRFARDKRQRVSSTERVERTPRPIRIFDL